MHERTPPLPTRTAPPARTRMQARTLLAGTGPSDHLFNTRSRSRDARDRVLLLRKELQAGRWCLVVVGVLSRRGYLDPAVDSAIDAFLYDGKIQRRIRLKVAR